MFRIAIILLLILALPGCASINTEYGVSMAPNTHGEFVPTYSIKLIIKN